MAFRDQEGWRVFIYKKIIMNNSNILKSLVFVVVLMSFVTKTQAQLLLQHLKGEITVTDKTLEFDSTATLLLWRKLSVQQQYAQRATSIISLYQGINKEQEELILLYKRREDSFKEEIVQLGIYLSEKERLLTNFETAYEEVVKDNKKCNRKNKSIIKYLLGGGIVYAILKL